MGTLCRLAMFGLVLIGLLAYAPASRANDVYVSQNGGGTGSSCTSALPVSFFNNSSNWGSGAGQIGPGTTVHLCGVISTTLQILGNGTSSAPVTILWTSGASVSLPVGNGFELNGHSHLVFDGGSPCGPATACSQSDSGTGIIENTDNGSQPLGNHSVVQAFSSSNGSGDVEIRNLIIRNLYRHTSTTDVTSSSDVSVTVFSANTLAGNLTAHDNTIHDVGTAFQLMFFSNSPTIGIYNNYIYNMDWGIGSSGNGARALNVHDNHFGSTTNWDTINDSFHHDGLHFYMNSAADSLGINIYNNLFDGDWGTCCATAFIFTETTNPQNFNVYNNVAVQKAGNQFPLFEIGATTGGIYNNTFVAGAAPTYNVPCLVMYGTGFSVQNNAFTHCGQWMVMQSGFTATVIDYNFYGDIGGSGNSPWSYLGTGVNSFVSWQQAGGGSCPGTGFDCHGGNPLSLGLTSLGLPTALSSILGNGVNICGTGGCSGAMSSLSKDTSAGATRTPSARPTTGAWYAGAYNSGTGTSSLPSPPSSLVATAN
jgi:hypothetical protein